MYIVYKATYKDKYYIGFTNDLSKRISSHQCSINSGKKSKFYDYARKYNFDNFVFSIIGEFEDKESAFSFEIENIKLSDPNCLNLAKGGEGGFVIPEYLQDGWKQKLKAARQGRKPAQGMSHTEDNKNLFSLCGKIRWDKYGRYPSEVISLSFKDAKQKYGISKTHYYRLKRAENNELS